jgi:hypothetical protein
MCCSHRLPLSERLLCRSGFTQDSDLRLSVVVRELRESSLAPDAKMATLQVRRTAGSLGSLRLLSRIPHEHVL